MLNPHSGKFLTAIDSVTTKIVEEQEFDQQLGQSEENDMDLESDMELDISVVSVDFDSMTL